MTRLVIWVRTHIKWLMPLLGAIAAAVKPVVIGGDYSTQQLLFAASLILGAFITYWAPNVEGGGLATYVKGMIVIALAGVGAAQQVLPGGISRQDLWTIGTAVVVSAGTLLFPTIAPRAVQSGGPGRMGDRGIHRDDGAGELGFLQAVLTCIVLALLAVFLLILIAPHIH